MLKHLCPCCNRHCYLDEPQCERGAIYAVTGEIPPRKPKPEGSQKKPHSEQKKIYRFLDQDSKLVWMLHRMGNAVQNLQWDAQSKPDEAGRSVHSALFSCLRPEDKADLLMLLEKVSHSWHHANKKSE